MPDTIQCKHCGTVNDMTTSICVNCLTPLTAYGGQVGQQENYTTRSDMQVAALETRPVAVTALTVCCGLYILAGPLWSILMAWRARPQVNEEGTNGIQAATGVLGPLFSTVLLLPVAVILAVIAFGVWTQRTWAWTAGAGALLGIAVLSLILHGVSVGGIFWVIAAGVLAFLWFQSATKSWYGLNS